MTGEEERAVHVLPGVKAAGFRVYSQAGELAFGVVDGTVVIGTLDHPSLVAAIRDAFVSWRPVVVTDELIEVGKRAIDEHILYDRECGCGHPCLSVDAYTRHLSAETLRATYDHHLTRERL